MKSKKKGPKWLTVWRVIEGDLIKGRVFEEDDSLILEGDEDVRYDYDDPLHIHVDDLTEGNGIFDNEGEAKSYAIKWMMQKIHDYQLKLARLHGTNTIKE